MVGPRQTKDDEELQKLNAAWSAAKAELSRLRDEVRRLAVLGTAQEDLTKARTEREAALSRLGEQVFEMVERRDLVPPEALRPALAEVRSMGGALARKQKSAAAGLREADAKKMKK